MSAAPTRPASSFQFAELRSPEAGALNDGSITVLLLPVGAVEPHGPHAPLSTDTIISSAVCERVASLLAGDASLRVLVLPPVAYGVTRYAQGFPGAISIGEHTLEAVVSEICAAVRAGGNDHVVIVNSHFEPEHVAALRRAADRTGALLFDVTRRRLAEQLTDEFNSGAAHAGSYETSIVLAVQPGLVDAERMRRLPALSVDMPAAIAAGQTNFAAMGMDQAYCGAPAAATPEEGEETLSTLTAMLVEMIRAHAA